MYSFRWLRERNYMIEGLSVKWAANTSGRPRTLEIISYWCTDKLSSIIPSSWPPKLVNASHIPEFPSPTSRRPPVTCFRVPAGVHVTGSTSPRVFPRPRPTFSQPKNSQWTLTFTFSSNGHLKLRRELVNVATVLDRGASVDSSHPKAPDSK